MTTTVTKSVGSAGGRDYSTLASWEDDTDNTSLITADEIRVAQLYNDSEFSTGNPGFQLAGATTDLTRYRQITTGPGQSFRDHANKLTNALTYNQANGVGITGGSFYAATIILNEKGVVIDSVQIKRTATGAGLYALSLATGTSAQKMFARNMIVKVEGGGYSVFGTGSPVVFTNMLIINDDPGSSVPALWFDFAETGSGAFNCTIVAPSDGTDGGTTRGILQTNGTTVTTLKNNAIFGPFTAAIVGTFNAASDYNATDKGSATGGAHDLVSQTYANQFEVVTTAGQDFRAKSGSLNAAGVTDSTNTADVDIVGQTRAASPNIGAWELVATTVLDEDGEWIIVTQSW